MVALSNPVDLAERLEAYHIDIQKGLRTGEG